MQNIRSIDEQRADLFFLTEVCNTEAYSAIQTELTARHERDLSGELPESYFAELSDQLRDLFDRCSSMCSSRIAQARELLDVPAAQPEAGDTSGAETAEPKPLAHPCPCCGGRMVIIERFERGSQPRYRPTSAPAVIRIDTS